MQRRGAAWGALLVAAALVAAGCTSHSGATSRPTARPTTPRTAARPVTRSMSIASVNAACTRFFQFDPGDLVDHPTLAQAKAYSNGRLRSIGAALASVDDVLLRPQDESLRTTTRDNMQRAGDIYRQVLALPANATLTQYVALTDEAQRLVVASAVALINFGANGCAPTSSPPDPSPKDAGRLIDLAPRAVIKVTEPLLNNDSIAADSRAVWIGVHGVGNVVRIDPESDALVATVKVGSQVTQPVVLVAGDLWVQTEREIVRVSGSTNRVDWRRPLLGLTLPGSAFTVGSGTLFVCARDTVRTVRIATGTRASDLHLAGNCKDGSLLIAGGDLLATSDIDGATSLERFDIASGRRIAALVVPRGSLGVGAPLALGPDGGVLADGYPGIFTIDSTHGRQATAARRVGTVGNVVVVAGGGFWFTRPAEHRVVRFDLASGRLDEIVAGAGAIGVAVSRGDLWVTNSDDGTVMRFPIDPWPPH